MKYVDTQIATHHLRNIRDELTRLYSEIIETVDLDDYSKKKLQSALLSSEFLNELRETIKSEMC